MPTSLTARLKTQGDIGLISHDMALFTGYLKGGYQKPEAIVLKSHNACERTAAPDLLRGLVISGVTPASNRSRITCRTALLCFSGVTQDRALPIHANIRVRRIIRAVLNDLSIPKLVQHLHLEPLPRHRQIRRNIAHADLLTIVD